MSDGGSNYVLRDEHEESFRNVYKRLDRVDATLEKLGDMIASRSSVNWGWIFAALTMMAGVLVFSIQAFVNPLATRQALEAGRMESIEADVDRNSERSVRDNEKWRLWERGLLARPPEGAP